MQCSIHTESAAYRRGALLAAVFTATVLLHSVDDAGAQVTVEHRQSSASAGIQGEIVNTSGGTTDFDSHDPTLFFSSGTDDLLEPFIADFSKTASISRSGFTLTPTVTTQQETIFTFEDGSLTSILGSFLAEVQTATSGSTSQLDSAFNESGSSSRFELGFEVDVPTELLITGSMSIEKVPGVDGEAGSAEGSFASFLLVGGDERVRHVLDQTSAQFQTISFSTTLAPNNYFLQSSVIVSLFEDHMSLDGGSAMMDFSLTFTPGEAQEYHWTNAAGGNFATPSNWDVDAYPAEPTHAVHFDFVGGTVNFDRDIVNGRLRVTEDVTFDLNGHIYEVHNADDAFDTEVAGGGRLTIRDGTLMTDTAAVLESSRLTVGPNGLFKADSLLVAAEDGAGFTVDQGHLNIRGELTLSSGLPSVANGGQLSIGNLDDGVSGGKLLLSGTGVGLLQIQDSGSQLTVDEILVNAPSQFVRIQDQATAVVKNRTRIEAPEELFGEGVGVRDRGRYNSPEGTLNITRGSFEVSTGGQAFFKSVSADSPVLESQDTFTGISVVGAESLFHVTEEMSLSGRLRFAVDDEATLTVGSLSLSNVAFLAGDIILDERDPRITGGATLNVGALTLTNSHLLVEGSTVNATAPILVSASVAATPIEIRDSTMNGTSLTFVGREGGGTFGPAVMNSSITMPQGVSITRTNIAFGGGELETLIAPITILDADVSFKQAATVHTGSVRIGSDIGSAESRLTLQDADTRLNIDTALSLGLASESELRIEADARATANLVHVGRHGAMRIDTGGDLVSQSGVVAGGVVLLEDGTGSTWQASGDINIGDPTLALPTRLRNNGRMSFATLRVHTGAIVDGDGLFSGSRAIMGGQFLPANSPGKVLLDVDLFELTANGTLEIEIGGLEAGVSSDQLVITGNADIAGTVLFKFIDGFAPQQGQQFEFLDVGGAANLTGASFELQNLAPGFEFNIMPTATGVNMTALNDGVFLQPVTWNVDADGDWSLAENWSEGDPNAAGVSASLLDVTTAPRTVNVDGPKTVASLMFDNTNGYTLSGPGPLQFDNGGFTSIQVTSGEHVISTPLSIAAGNTLTARGAGTLTIGGVQDHGAGAVLLANGGVINLNSDGGANLSVHSNARLNFGATQHLAGVTVGEGGTATLTLGDSKNLVTRALSIAGGDTPSGTLDLTDNAAVVDFPETGPNPATQIRQQILVGRGGAGFGATWSGTGITSSTAASQVAAEPESVSIGYATNGEFPLGPYATFRDETVDDSAVLILYTRTGDANLDGLVNDADVTIVGATYAPGVPQPHWALGDFDYNGFVDDADVTLLGVFYDPSAPPLVSPLAAGTAPAAATTVAVPEPANVVLLAVMLFAWAAAGACVRPRCTVGLFESSENPATKKLTQGRNVTT